MKKRILVVSFKIGLGHFKAAEATRNYISENYPDCEAKHVDLMDYSNVISRNFYQKGYLAITGRVPAFYSYLYHHTSTVSNKFRLGFDLATTKKFKKLVLDFKPDLIICTHFVAANLLPYWRKRLKLDYKIAFILTDFEAHPFLMVPGIDLYAVASEEVKNQLVSNKIDPQKIKVTGIPIGSNFNQNLDRKELQKEFGLDNKFTILLMNGGFGVGVTEKIFTHLQEITEDLQVISVTGYNKKLEQEMQTVAEKSAKTNKVFGFTKRIPELMTIADLIISKAGGLTVSEALSVGTPLLIFRPTPGQEEANTKYLLKKQAALNAKTVTGIFRIINRALSGDIDLKEIRKNIKEVAKPKSTQEVVELSLDLIGENK